MLSQRLDIEHRKKNRNALLMVAGAASLAVASSRLTLVEEASVRSSQGITAANPFNKASILYCFKTARRLKLTAFTKNDLVVLIIVDPDRGLGWPSVVEIGLHPPP